MIAQVIQGDYYSSVDRDQVELHTQALICVDQQGIIDRIVEPGDREYAGIVQQAQREGRLIKAADDQVILPGFIDLHVHAPQWPNAGLALDLPLEDWLQH